MLTPCKNCLWRVCRQRQIGRDACPCLYVNFRSLDLRMPVSICRSGEGAIYSNCVAIVSFAYRAVNNPIKQLNKTVTAYDELLIVIDRASRGLLPVIACGFLIETASL